MDPSRGDVQCRHQSISETGDAVDFHLGGLGWQWSTGHQVHQGWPSRAEGHVSWVTGSWLTLGQHSPAIWHDLDDGGSDDLGPEDFPVERRTDLGPDRLCPDARIMADLA